MENQNVLPPSSPGAFWSENPRVVRHQIRSQTTGARSWIVVLDENPRAGTARSLTVREEGMGRFPSVASEATRVVVGDGVEGMARHVDGKPARLRVARNASPCTSGGDHRSPRLLAAVLRRQQSDLGSHTAGLQPAQ